MAEDVLVLDHEAVAALLPVDRCIEVMAAAFGALADGGAVQPARTILPLPSGDGSLYVMPAWSGEPEALAVKLLTLFPGNEARGLPTHRGVVVLLDPEHGGLLALLDAAALTAVRTAAVSALATRLLAREDAAVLALIGSGVQARSHLEAMRTVRPIARVRVWSPARAHRERFAALEAERHDIEVSATTSPEDAVRGADIICTVTSAREPVVERGWLSPGVHINAVGASAPDTRELDSRTVADARLFVDLRAAALAEAGDVLLPIAEGAIDATHIRGELGDLVTGRVEGRTSPADVTAFKSLGLAVEDAAAATEVVRAARESGAGRTFAFGPAAR